MSKQNVGGSHESDPGDWHQLEEITDRLINGSITEPFAAGYSGEIEPVDIMMRAMLRAVAARPKFQTLLDAQLLLGSRAVHYNTRTVPWN